MVVLPARFDTNAVNPGVAAREKPQVMQRARQGVEKTLWAVSEI